MGQNDLFGLRLPFDLVPKYKAKCERDPLPHRRAG